MSEIINEYELRIARLEKRLAEEMRKSSWYEEQIIWLMNFGKFDFHLCWSPDNGITVDTSDEKFSDR